MLVQNLAQSVPATLLSAAAYCKQPALHYLTSLTLQRLAMFQITFTKKELQTLSRNLQTPKFSITFPAITAPFLAIHFPVICSSCPFFRLQSLVSSYAAPCRKTTGKLTITLLDNKYSSFAWTARYSKHMSLSQLNPFIHSQSLSTILYIIIPLSL
jgi:hypothetical protein